MDLKLHLYGFIFVLKKNRHEHVFFEGLVKSLTLRLQDLQTLQQIIDHFSRTVQNNDQNITHTYTDLADLANVLLLFEYIEIPLLKL